MYVFQIAGEDKNKENIQQRKRQKMKAKGVCKWKAKTRTQSKGDDVFP